MSKIRKMLFLKKTVIFLKNAIEIVALVFVLLVIVALVIYLIATDTIADSIIISFFAGLCIYSSILDKKRKEKIHKLIH